MSCFYRGSAEGFVHSKQSHEVFFSVLLGLFSSLPHASHRSFCSSNVNDRLHPPDSIDSLDSEVHRRRTDDFQFDRFPFNAIGGVR
jgi:hypothetical protein